jgi:hypothetical protein
MSFTAAVPVVGLVKALTVVLVMLVKVTCSSEKCIEKSIFAHVSIPTHSKTKLQEQT